MNSTETLGKDCCGQDIIPCRSTLSIYTNRHPNCNGTRWGWIEGCTLNICWSDDKAFNSKAACNLVNEFNNKRKPKQ